MLQKMKRRPEASCVVMMCSSTNSNGSGVLLLRLSAHDTASGCTSASRVSMNYERGAVTRRHNCASPVSATVHLRQPGATALLFVLLIAMTAGCTAAQWYEGARAGALQRCDALPPGAHDDCVKRAELPPYDEYRKEQEKGQALPK